MAYPPGLMLLNSASCQFWLPQPVLASDVNYFLISYFPNTFLALIRIFYPLSCLTFALYIFSLHSLESGYLALSLEVCIYIYIIYTPNQG